MVPTATVRVRDEQALERIWERVRDSVAAIDGRLRSVTVLADNRRNLAAEVALSGSVRYSPGAFDRLDTDGEVAFVFAHELGHLLLAESRALPQGGVADEILADIVAVSLVRQAGFRLAHGHSLLRLVAEGGNVERTAGLADVFRALDESERERRGLLLSRWVPGLHAIPTASVAGRLVETVLSAPAMSVETAPKGAGRSATRESPRPSVWDFSVLALPTASRSRRTSTDL